MRKRPRGRPRSLQTAAVCGALVLVLHAAVSAQPMIDGHIVPGVDEAVTLVINVPQRMLFRFEGGRLAEAHPIGVGRRSWPTPLGDFEIISKEVNPTWDVPVSIQEEMRQAGKPVVTRVLPGPNNPLGTHWLGLSLHNIGIHGTSVPSSVYQASTHGCIRLRANAIVSLYAQIAIGDRGRIVYEPLLLARTVDGVFLEAHPDIYRRSSRPALEFVESVGEALSVTADIDWARVDRVLREQNGVATSISVTRGPVSSYEPGHEGAGAVGGRRDE